jgi:hypothetical protein
LVGAPLPKRRRAKEKRIREKKKGKRKWAG